MKIKRAGSNRVNSSTRHKVERKKREHKRDLRRAAKALKASGVGPKRSKKSREAAQMALKVSNAHPDKEEILTRILQSREKARVVRADRRSQRKEDALRGKSGEEAGSDGEEGATPAVQPISRTAGSNTKNLLFIPNSKCSDFVFQFRKSINEMIYPIRTADEEAEDADSVEVPAAAFLITVDARCAVQSCPWSLLDAIVERGEQYAAAKATTATNGVTGKKRERSEEVEGAEKRLLVLFAMTKVDLISALAVATQLSLLADALDRRYFQGSKNQQQSGKGERSLPGGIVFTFCPVSTQFEMTARHLLKILRHFNLSQQGRTLSKNARNNLKDKICVFVAGLPSTGRRSLTRVLAETGTDSSVAVVPLRAAQVQLIRNRDNDSVDVRLAFPNAKNIVFVTYPEDSYLRNQLLSQLTSGDIVFQGAAYVERLPEPESVAVMILDGVVDRAGMSQAFCQPLLGTSAEGPKESIRFLKGIGYTVRREKGFHVSPLFVSGVGTAGKLGATSLTASTGFCSGEQSTQGTLLDSSFSAASPNKLIRISSVVSASRGKGKRNMTVKRVDGHNVLRIGARTLVREFFQSKNVPWSILRAEHALTPAGVAQSSWVLSLDLFRLGKVESATDAQEHLTGWMEAVNDLLRNVLILLPHRVVEMSPTSVVPVLHDLTEQKPEPSSDDEEESDGDDVEEDVEEDDVEEDEGDDEEADDDAEEDEAEEEEDEEEEVVEPPKKVARHEVAAASPAKQQQQQSPAKGGSVARPSVQASPRQATTPQRSSKGGPSPRK